MKTDVERWIKESRTKLNTIPLDASDLDQLETLVKEPRQVILYLTARSTNMRSGIVSWVLFDPAETHEPTLPSEDLPYNSVLEAVADSWHVVQFPVINLYEYKDIENDYIGFDFILEKWI